MNSYKEKKRVFQTERFDVFRSLFRNSEDVESEAHSARCRYENVLHLACTITVRPRVAINGQPCVAVISDIRCNRGGTEFLLGIQDFIGWMNADSVTHASKKLVETPTDLVRPSATQVLQHDVSIENECGRAATNDQNQH